MERQKARTATVERRTNETDIRAALSLNGGTYQIETGVGFFDHMLTLFSRHGAMGLTLRAAGDTQIDDHHTVEDVGIVLGKALHDALGDKQGIERYGFASVPMDEALARVSVDLSGRSSLIFQVAFPDAKIGTFDTALVEEFLAALVNNGRFNCHVEVPHGRNSHHVAEATFKALGRALRQAAHITGTDVPSTKGIL